MSEPIDKELAVRDNCESCNGLRGGVPGNENRVNGRVVCDYCHAEGGVPGLGTEGT